MKKFKPTLLIYWPKDEEFSEDNAMVEEHVDKKFLEDSIYHFNTEYKHLMYFLVVLDHLERSEHFIRAISPEEYQKYRYLAYPVVSEMVH